MDESFLTGFLLTATTLHAVLTLLVNALREVSHSRLEQELQSPEQIETFNELLADDHDTIEDLSNLRGLSLIVAAVSLALLFVHRLEPGETSAWRSLLGLAGSIFGLLVISHTLPRAFGDRFAERIVIRVLPPLKQNLWMLRPLTRPFRLSTLIALRIVGTPEKEDAIEEADDEILSAAVEAVRDGVLEKAALGMIEKVIEFRDAEVTEIMTPRIDVTAIDRTAGFDEAVHRMIDHGLSRLPVYEDSIDKIIGIVHIKDMLKQLAEPVPVDTPAPETEAEPVGTEPVGIDPAVEAEDVSPEAAPTVVTEATVASPDSGERPAASPGLASTASAAPDTVSAAPDSTPESKTESKPESKTEDSSQPAEASSTASAESPAADEPGVPEGPDDTAEGAADTDAAAEDSDATSEDDSPGSNGHLADEPHVIDPRLEAALRKPLFVPESKRARDLFVDLKRDKVHMAVVVDEYGGTAGVVTLYDIVSEIFGDVDDEHDAPARKPVVRLTDEHFSVDGKVHIDELNETLGLSIPEEDEYDTIGGYLATQLGKIPEIGDNFRHEDLLFRVTEGDARKVDRIEIRLGRS